jgi:hypothetical protein
MFSCPLSLKANYITPLHWSSSPTSCLEQLTFISLLRITAGFANLDTSSLDDKHAFLLLSASNQRC